MKTPLQRKFRGASTPGAIAIVDPAAIWRVVVVRDRLSIEFSHSLSLKRVLRFTYTGGYITRIKNRDAHEFVWMSKDAGGSGSNKGVYFAGADWEFMKDGRVRADLQYGVDVYNTFYIDAKLPFDFDERTRLTLGAQYLPQRSVGDAQIGDFSTWGAGLQAHVAHGPFGAHLSFTRTGTDFATQNPYGDHPSYLNLQQVPFNSAGERAWGLGGSINFATLGVPGLSAAAAYAAGTDRVANLTGAPIPDRNETDLRADYRFTASARATCSPARWPRCAIRGCSRTARHRRRRRRRRG